VVDGNGIDEAAEEDGRPPRKEVAAALAPFQLLAFILLWVGV